MISPDSPTSGLQKIARVLLGSFMLFAGVGHLSFQREEFQAQVPPWVPMEPDLVVVLSGWVEIILGLSMVFAVKWKVWVGCALAGFYLAVFPGNVSQYTRGIDAFGLDSDRARLVRLFFQPVLILWALWCTGALREIRRRFASSGSDEVRK